MATRPKSSPLTKPAALTKQLSNNSLERCSHSGRPAASEAPVSGPQRRSSIKTSTSSQRPTAAQRSGRPVAPQQHKDQHVFTASKSPVSGPQRQIRASSIVTGTQSTDGPRAGGRPRVDGQTAGGPPDDKFERRVDWLCNCLAGRFTSRTIGRQIHATSQSINQPSLPCALRVVQV